MKKWLFLIIILVLVVMPVFLYHWLTTPTISVAPLPQSTSFLGEVDMDEDLRLGVEEMLRGKDVVIILDNRFFSSVPMNGSRFQLEQFDANDDRVLDSQDPIWRYINAVLYNPDGSYTIKSLSEVGIVGVKKERLPPPGQKHEVIMDDGSSRVLYETQQNNDHLNQ